MEVKRDSQTIHTYTFKLDAKEAKALYIVMGCVGGLGPVRNVVNDIVNGLREAGIDCGIHEYDNYITQKMFVKNRSL